MPYSGNLSMQEDFDIQNGLYTLSKIAFLNMLKEDKMTKKQAVDFIEKKFNLIDGEPLFFEIASFSAEREEHESLKDFIGRIGYQINARYSKETRF